MAKSIRALAIRRILLGIPILLGETVLVFGVVALAPSSPATARLSNMNPEALQRLQEQLGLNRPLHVQYVDWLTNVLQGDLGNSLISGEPVAPLLVNRLSVSLELGLLGFLWMVVMAGSLGIIGAFNHNELPDHVARVYAILGISTPDFVVGIFSILIFGVWLGWLPAGGWEPLSAGVITNLKHAILPSYAVGFLFTGIITRLFRADLLETMNDEHVNAAKAMGLSKQRIIRQDIIKPAVIPTLTAIGMTVTVLVGGLVLTEIVFAIPGMGRLAVRAIFNGNYPVIQAVLLVVASAFIVVNIIVDIAYYYLDPRIRVQED
jgi:peptide/nickel transport system permease protein